MPTVTAIAAVGALAYGVYSGETGKAKATESRRNAQRANEEALRKQMLERQRSVQTDMRSDRPTPASSIAMTDALLSPTDKTGGIDDRLKLTRSAKLGGGA